MLDRLAALFYSQPDIPFASVFGSVAAETARPDSDVDVAVLIQPPLDAGRKQQLIAQLAEVSGRPVDLVDLHDAGPVVLRSALSGRRLIGKGGAANAALLSRAITDATDFLPVRERILRQRREAWAR